MVHRALMLAACLCVAQIRGDTVTPTISGNIGDREKAGQELAKRVLSMAPRQNSQVNGILKIRDAEGRTTDIPVSSEVVVDGNTWQVSYLAKPAASRAEEKLTILHAVERPNEYLYSKASSAGVLPPPQRLAPAQANIPFAGSDFWLTDLGLEFLHWPKQRLIKTEMRHSTWCNVLESINPVATSGYARVLSWLDKESGGPVMAEGYDQSGRLLKEFSIRGFAKVQGEYQLKEMQIRSTQAKTRTRLEFELDNK
jgi:hypothetical protein